MYRIWVQAYVGSTLVGAAVSSKEYKRKGNAEVAAKRRWRPQSVDCFHVTYKWVVAEANPWADNKPA